jgi:hypothetical protein
MKGPASCGPYVAFWGLLGFRRIILPNGPW